MFTAPGSTLTDETLTDETLTGTAPTAFDAPAFDGGDSTALASTDGTRDERARTGEDEVAGNDLPSGEVELPCWSADPDLWFAESPADVEAAKALCVPCPLREACLAGALERREPWGVWGGQLLVAGVVVARKRPRGRPRKTDLAA